MGWINRKGWYLMATNPPCHPCEICGGKLEWEAVPVNMAWPWEQPRFGPTQYRQLPHECPPGAAEEYYERIFDRSAREPFFKEVKP